MQVKNWVWILLLAGVAGGCTHPVSTGTVPPSYPELKAPRAAPGIVRVTVVGAVTTPGVYDLRPTEPSMLLHLLLQMGGPAGFTATKASVFRRQPDGTEVETKVDLEELMKRGDPKKDVPLQTGDRVVFKQHRLAL